MKRTATIGTALALVLASGTAAAGDDLRNIGVGTGLGVLGQILQGKPVTLEGVMKSAAGAAAGSQVGDGSGAAAAAAIGGLAGETLVDGLTGMVSAGGAAPASAGSTGTAASTSVLAGMVPEPAPPARVVLDVEPSVRVAVGAGGALQACEGARCVPVTLAAPTHRVVLAGPDGALLCEGAGTGLLCRDL